MCGLTAIIATNSVNINELISMNDTIIHRGPDDEGFFLKSFSSDLSMTFSRDKHDFKHYDEESYKQFNVGLGHRRLSILDLTSAGHQPMTSHDNNLTIIFNGEIYNYKALRVLLNKEGFIFKTQTDTEVILNAWSFWGESCLSKLEGMFSIIIFNNKTNTLYAIRDRFGIKPLYYFQNDRGIYFASEIKQFMAINTWKATQNYQIVYDFLNWSLIDHTNETFFKGVYQVLPGEILKLTISNKKINTLRKMWYSLSFSLPFLEYNDEKNSYKDLFVNSVSMHLQADVSVGSCLSGGIDSSSIVGVINSLKKNNQTQKTFSALSHDPRIDESKWIDCVVKAQSLDAYFITPTASLLENSLNELTYSQDEPFRSTSTFAQWCVFKLAHEQGVKVMIDGQGADEQLGGYASFWGVLLAEKICKGHWSDFSEEYKAILKNSGLSYFSLFQRVVNPFVKGRFSGIIRNIITDNKITPPWFDFKESLVDKRDPFLLLNSRTSSFQQFSIAQTKSINLQSLLHLEDRNSMAHSVEARVPFLDHNLVEKSLSLPTEYKFKQGVSKRILRDAMKNYIPEKIYNL
ncbi:asparagine synthase (glutamine-hydrolyzing) [sulfur-oxidizing endosymbiont of Gigantopelta aegis]|uniref:asparagine synthase (glutamine-hydrolyzing) n=1 Tax=sulfur-oxidizing endosymbiont of Gigantopelta aegis TaxID=2794934 RepID=UPI002483944D|nr:asparagine synthase (glutamine-hydrolyzing) [sulfur-oxidizing endosymbiont of Gigantopelta aegis]